MDKRELKQIYKEMKPEMGVFAYKCIPTGKMYIGCGKNIKADTNSITFQLKLNNFPTNINLQKDWAQYGENNFEIIILEILKYDKDESKTDYKDDLRLLREMVVTDLKDVELI